MKRWAILFLIIAVIAAQSACAEDRIQFLNDFENWVSDTASDLSDWAVNDGSQFLNGFESWVSDTASDLSDWAINDGSQFLNDFESWVSDTASDLSDWAANDGSQFLNGFENWVSDTAGDLSDWAAEVASDAWVWTNSTANDVWNGITGFFDPPCTEGDPSIVPEPELPAGTQKMYLGYPAINTGLDNGYSQEREIDRDDPHFGMTLGKFYVSGFTSAVSMDRDHFVFLKTPDDNVELHFELVQDIDMLDGDTFVSINSDDGGYDQYFGISPTSFGRGTLIIRHTDYQNNIGTAQVYTDFLANKMSSSADTVIPLNEEGDYEVALDYEIKQDRYVLGTEITRTSYSDYRIFFRFSIRNGICMVFPYTAATE